MEIGRRYIYVDTDNETYAGDVVSITDNMVTIQNRSCESYKNSSDLFHIELNLIKWIFLLDNLIEGHQYCFTLNKDNKMIEGTFINISGINDTVYLQTTNSGVLLFSIYEVNDIHKIL